MNDTCYIQNYVNIGVSNDLTIVTGGYDLKMENVSITCQMNAECKLSIILNTNKDRN